MSNGKKVTVFKCMRGEVHIDTNANYWKSDVLKTSSERKFSSFENMKLPRDNY